MTIVTIAVETAPSTNPIVRERIAAGVKVPGTHKKPETIEKWIAEEKPALVEARLEDTKNNPFLADIVKIGVMLDNGGIEVFRAHTRFEGLSTLLDPHFAVLGEVTAFGAEWHYRMIVSALARTAGQVGSAFAFDRTPPFLRCTQLAIGGAYLGLRPSLEDACLWAGWKVPETVEDKILAFKGLYDLVC